MIQRSFICPMCEGVGCSRCEERGHLLSVDTWLILHREIYTAPPTPATRKASAHPPYTNEEGVWVSGPTQGAEALRITVKRFEYLAWRRRIKSMVDPRAPKRAKLYLVYPAKKEEPHK